MSAGSYESTMIARPTLKLSGPKWDAETSVRPHQLELFGGAAVPLDLGLVGEPRVVANVDDGLEQLKRLLNQLRPKVANEQRCSHVEQ